MVEFTGRIEGIDEVIRMLNGTPEAVEKALVHTLNRLGQRGMTYAGREIRKIYNIKRESMASAFTLYKAQRQGRSGVRLSTEIVARGTRGKGGGGSLPLYDFGAKPEQPSAQAGVPRAKRRGNKVSVKIFKGQPRTKLGNNAFTARMESGHVGIFVRTSEKMRTKNKPAIKEKFQYSAATMFEYHGVKAIDTLLEEQGLNEFTHDLGFYLDKLSKGQA